MAISHKLMLKVGFDGSAASKGFRMLGGEAAASMADAALGIDKLTNKIRMIGVGMIAAGAAGATGMYRLAQSASDLNETVNKTAEIFGDDMIAGLREWAKEADQSMAMSERAALDAASTFGIFFANAGKSGEAAAEMSKEMTKLAADFASFFNTSPEEAITAIGAAFRGETEPIRRYGILINEAELKQEALRMGLIKTTTGALTPQQRVLAAYNVILAQSSQAQGDFAKTQDTMANQQRILAAEMENLRAAIGEGLVPAFEVMLNIATRTIGVFVDAINAIPLGVREALGWVAMFTTGLTALGGVLTIVASHVISSSLAVKGLEMASARLPGRLGKAAQSASNLASSKAKLKKAITALVAVMMVYELAQEQSAKREQERQKIIEGMARATIPELTNSINEQLDAWLALRGIDLTDWLKEVAKENVGVTQTLYEAAQGNEELRNRLAERGVTLEVLKNIIDTEVAAQQRSNDVTQKGTELVDDNTDATQDAIDAHKQENKELRGLADALGEANDQYEQLVDNHKELIGLSLDSTEAVLDLADAADDYREVMEDGEATDRDRARAQVDFQNQIRDTAEALNDEYEQQLLLSDGYVDAGKSRENYINILKMMQAQYPELAAEIQKEIDALESIPEMEETQIVVNGVPMSIADIKLWIQNLDDIPEKEKTDIYALLDEGAYAQAEARLNYVARNRETRITVRTNNQTMNDSIVNNGGMGYDDYGGKRAYGGSVNPNKFYQVAERGPELLQQDGKTFLLGGDGRVVPLAAGAGMAMGTGGATFNISINVGPGTTPSPEFKRAVYEAMEAWRRQNGGRF